MLGAYSSCDSRLGDVDDCMANQSHKEFSCCIFDDLNEERKHNYGNICEMASVPVDL